MQPTVVITGVSSGIGRDAASYLSKHGYFVFGSVRSESARTELGSALPENFRAVVFDVVDRPAIDAAAKIVADHLGDQRLTALINNAGIAEGGPMQLLEDDRFLRQIQVNVIGTRNVTNAFLPHLGVRDTAQPTAAGRPGKIINISSISGILNTPMNGAYCVSKHAQESLGEIYRRELMQYGIDVISIQPGPIRSELWNKNLGTMERFADSRYSAMIANAEAIMAEAKQEALPAETISRLIEKIIQARRPSLSYIVHSQKWRAWLLSKLPARWTDRLLWKRLNRPLPDETK